MAARIRKIIAILLCVTSVVLMLLPANTSYASTVKGDYEIDGSTLVKYLGSDANVTIPSFIETVGKDAFSGNDNLIKVTIPDTVRKIDFAAFENCKNLKQAVLPQSVKAIGSSAFSGCENLEYVNIPAKCEEILPSAFANCNKLSNISIDGGNSKYICADGVLYTLDGKELVQYLAGRPKTAYAMPATIEFIDRYAFYGAKNLSDISLSSKLKEIPEYAFSNCVGLTNVVLPYNVESLLAYSFSDCYNLKNVTVPDSVSYIDEKAFYKTNDVNVNYYDANEVKNRINADGASEESFEEYISNVNSDSYNISVSGTANERKYYENLPYVSSMTPDFTENKTPNEIASSKIVGGEAVIFMRRDVPAKGFGIEEAESEDDMAYSGNSSYTSDGNYINSSGILASYNGNESNIIIPSDIHKIGNRAFYKKNNVRGVQLPSSLDEIGDFAFSRSGIESIDISNNTSKIGYAAFYNCNRLSNVTIPSSVSRIELGAFDGTKWLNDWCTSDDNNDFLIVGDGILLAYKGRNAEVSVPEGVKQISAGCFKGNARITSISFPSSLELIGEDSFNGCSSLADITLPESLISIEDRAFKDCPLTQAIIPKNVKYIGLSAFDNTSLSSDGKSLINTVVLLGKNLPELAYNDTATRLSAKDLRSMPFEGINNIVVGPTADISSISIISPSVYGFRGQVYTITSDATERTGELKLLQSTLIPDDNGDCIIDPHIVINDKNYIMSGLAENALDNYKNINSYTNKKLGRLSIDGNTSIDVENILDDINAKYGSSNVDNRPIDEKVELYLDIPVNFDESISPDKGGAKALAYETEGSYIINVSKSDAAKEKATQAILNRYGSIDGINSVALDFNMYDISCGIPITKLSNKKIELSVPVPTELISASSINVAAIDDNGVLNEISSDINNNDGNDKIRFVADHFSVYVFYVKSYEESIITNYNEESLAFNNNTAVLKTLHKRVFNIEAKWYVIVIMLSIAMILFLYRDRPKRLEK